MNAMPDYLKLFVCYGPNASNQPLPQFEAVSEAVAIATSMRKQVKLLDAVTGKVVATVNVCGQMVRQ